MLDKIIGQLPGLAVGAIATSALTQYFLTSVRADRFPGPARVEPFSPRPVPELDFHLEKFSPSHYWDGHEKTRESIAEALHRRPVPKW